MKTKILFIIFALIEMSCMKESQSSVQPVGSNFQVEFLFEYDGCKVYRFIDHRTVYYTDCRGTVQSTYRSGKTTQYDQVSTSGRK